MASLGLQLVGCALALLGWIGVIVVCAAPMWRVTAFIGNNIVTSQTVWEGIWMSCVVQSTGQMQCKMYDSMLALGSDLQGARALVVVSIVTGIVGLLIAFTGGKCTNFIAEEGAKAKASIAAGVLLIVSGLLCIIPVSWTASNIIRDFYNPVLVDAQRRELGASLYIGWGAGALLLLGGALLCANRPPKQDKTPSEKPLLKLPAGKSDMGMPRPFTLPSKKSDMRMPRPSTPPVAKSDMVMPRSSTPPSKKSDMVTARSSTPPVKKRDIDSPGSSVPHGAYSDDDTPSSSTHPKTYI